MNHLRLATCLLALAFVAGTSRLGAAPPGIDAELAKQAEKAMAEGAQYLIDQQNEDGSWGDYKHPAMSALAVIALHDAPGVDAAQRQQAIDRAMNYVLSFRQPNGAIYPADRDMSQSANYPNYTTSLSLLAMAVLNREEYLPHMRQARQYLMNSQFDDPDKVDYGGIGYGRTQRADLSNLSFSAEALYFTDYLAEEPYAKDSQAEKKTKEMWERMQTFITKCQNLPKTNEQPYISDHPKDRGGFIYRPFESKAGSRSDSDKDGKVTDLVSSGSMTYAGLKTMLYARLDRSDVRVKAAMDYLQRHWTLEENPGMGMQGLFYYLHAMAKALDAYDQPVITDAEGNKHPWRAEITRKLLELQRDDGSWANTHGRYMESMPVLATSYGVTTLKVATGKMDLKHPKATRK